MKPENNPKQKKPKPLPPTWVHGFIDAGQCQELRGCSRAHHHQTVREGKFPAPAIRSPRYSRWRGSDVKAYLDDPQGWVLANSQKEVGE